MALPAHAVKARSFDPRSVPGLQAWYDAADSASVTLDAGRVSQWSDKSGNGRHATNTTSGATQPSYTTAARNGLNVLRFEAASVQRLTVPSSTTTFKFFHDGTDSYIAAVSVYGTVANPQASYGLLGNSRGSLPPSFQVVYSDVSSISANDALRLEISSSFTTVANSLNAGNTAVLPENLNLAPAMTAIVQEFTFDADNAAASQRTRIRVNGGAEVANNNKTGAWTTAAGDTDLQLGAVGNNVAPLQGDICELMLFSQLPTSQARNLIRRYLGAKWGVAVQ